MGQTHDSFLSNQKQLAKTFKIESRVQDLNLLHLRHLTNNKAYLLRQQNFTEERQQIDMLTKVKERQGWSSPHLTNLISKHQNMVEYEQNKRQDMCAKYFRVLSLWEYPFRTLAQQVTAKALVKQPMPPGQIRALMTGIAEGALTLQKQKIPHECLTAKTLLIEGDTHFRLVDPIAIPVSPNLEVVYHNRSIKTIYLSPEQCRLIDQQDISRGVAEPYKSDVFTAGMLVLQAGLLERQDSCYNDDCARINQKELEGRINRFGDMYGYEMRRLLDMMLEIDVSRRVGWQQLIQKINGRQIKRSARQSLELVYIKREQSPNKSYVFTYQSGRETNVPHRPVTTSNGDYNHLNLNNNNPVNVNTSNQSKRPIHLGNNSTNKPSLDPPNPVNNINFLPKPTAKFTYHPNNSVTVNHTKTNTPTNPSSLPTYTNHQQEMSPQAQQPIIEFDQAQPIYSIDQFKNGSKYQGYKLAGKREGFGKYTYQDGGSYEGEWKNDLMCGRGKLYYQSGKIAYQGYLENDLFHGTGTLFNEQPEILMRDFNYRNFEDIEQFWVNYQGQFRHDKKEGKGILLLTNGQRLESTFHEDKVDGQGLFVTRVGQQIRGIWHQNRFQRQL